MTDRIGIQAVIAIFTASCVLCAISSGQNRPQDARHPKPDVAAASQPQTSPASAIQYIDVHNHLVNGPQKDYEGVVEMAFAAMEQGGMKKLIIMSPPGVEENKAGLSECDVYLPFFKKHPGRFAFLGGGASLNIMIHSAAQESKISDDLRKQFEKKADEILKSGASGFGEIAIRHLSLHNTHHPYENVAADHPLLLLLADIAAKNDVPIDLHCDVVAEDMKTPDYLQSPPNPKTLSANLPAFERLLEHNPKTKFCWEHAGSDNTGQWTAELTRKMLDKHPNLYMALRMGTAHSFENFPLKPDGKIKQEWLSIFQDYPTRFMIGSDQFFMSSSVKDTGPGSGIPKKSPMSREGARKLLSALPEDLAKKIGCENAASLFKLKD